MRFVNSSRTRSFVLASKFDQKSIVPVNEKIPSSDLESISVLQRIHEAPLDVHAFVFDAGTHRGNGIVNADRVAGYGVAAAEQVAPGIAAGARFTRVKYDKWRS